jgi:pimeloyl-ACP methyl ester carboxylesterase
MSSTDHIFVSANGLRHHLVERGKGPLVLLLHGFPEGWYSWRHQLDALSSAGYRAVAPDVRGYGETDAPHDVASYRMRELVADAVGLLDALEERTAVVVGHDWGAVIAWHCALLHPERFRGVAALSVPYSGRPPAPPTAIFRQRFAGTFFYILYFQEPGIAEAELESDVRRSLRLVYYNVSGDAPLIGGLYGKPPDAKFLEGMVEPTVLPPWLSEGDLDVYVEAFRRSGFRGPLNRYRNMDRDWEDLAALAGAKVGIPALFVTGDRDLGYKFDPAAIDRMKQHVPHLRDIVVLPGAGHWTQQERPVETNAALVAFLRELDATSRPRA